MAARLGERIALATGLALAACLVALAVSPAVPGAAAAGCGKWGKAAPAKLSGGHARKAILCLVNKQRRKAGLRALSRDRRLQKAAQRHSRSMDGTGCFDHVCAGERDLDGRLAQVGYLVGGLSQWAYGENIAWGLAAKGSPRSIVRAWMNSPGHRANILDRSFRELGVGFAVGSPGSGAAPGGIYTTDFGLRMG